jgi:hypothetical protein
MNVERTDFDWKNANPVEALVEEFVAHRRRLSVRVRRNAFEIPACATLPRGNWSKETINLKILKIK